MAQHVRILGMACVALASTACVINVNDESVVVREERRFAVSGDPDLTLNTFDGSIRVQAWDRNEVLIEIARTVRRLVRNEDVFARYGGEEFGLILRGIDITGARAVAERLRTQVEKLGVASDRGAIHVTISVGCSSLATTSEPSTETLVQSADRRLYAAKNTGRNRVVAND